MKQNPRVALTIPPDLNDVLQSIADFQGVAKTRVITDFLLEAKPLLIQLDNAYKKIKSETHTAQEVQRQIGLEILSIATKASVEITNDLIDMEH